MGLFDEEFYCEKCNWFTYRHSPVPYIKPAPRCPRCGLVTRIAVAADAINASMAGKSHEWPHCVHDEINYANLKEETTSLKEALELTRDFHDRYPSLNQAIVPRRDVLKQAETDNRKCRECSIILLTNSDTGLCDTCLVMFNAIASQPGLREAHIQWEIENQRRITAKQRIMRG